MVDRAQNLGVPSATLIQHLLNGEGFVTHSTFDMLGHCDYPDNKEP